MDDPEQRQTMSGCGPAHRLLDIGAKPPEEEKIIDIAKLEGVPAPRRFGDYDVMIHPECIPNVVELWAWNTNQSTLVKTE